MPSDIQLFLSPAPGAKPEFLATLQRTDGENWAQSLHSTSIEKIVLSDYTRDSWAWKPSKALASIPAESTDGRHKLPGFVRYLKDRQKSAFGRFGSAGVCVVSYVQTIKASDGNSSSNNDSVMCRIATDVTKIPNCPLQPRVAKPAATAASPAVVEEASSKPAATNIIAPMVSKRKKGAGLLGKLVGAQQHTNKQVATVTKKAVVAAPSAGDGGTIDGESGGSNNNQTAQQVFAKFRQSCQDKMLDFDMAEDLEVLKVPIKLSEYTSALASLEERSKVTMEVLKYMVYEAAEEVSEEWIAHKEPAEFMDEIVVAVYKDSSQVPPEIMEELNKGELPDEIRGQQRAMAEELARQAQNKASRRDKEVVAQAQAQEEDFEVLNTKKRDRRTIDDYEREKRSRES